jgi:receptor protein-tyrosine kinase
MMRLLEQLSTRYPDRIIVFDSPPLLVTTEARELASHMGQIVMVVEAGKTPRSAVKDALAAIEGCDVVGLLLNKAAHVKDGGHYSYGGYGYGAD